MSSPLDSALGFPSTVDPGFVRSSDTLPVAGSNQAHYARVRDAGMVSKIGLQVGVQSGNVSVAVYRNTGTGRTAAPGTRIATSGAVSCPAVGYAEIALGGAVQVYAGDWLCLTADNVTATFRTQLSSGADSDLGKGRQYRQAASGHPAPSPAGTLIATVGWTHVLVGVR